MINNISCFLCSAYNILFVLAALLQQRVAHCHVHLTRIIIYFSSSKKLLTYRYCIVFVYIYNIVHSIIERWPFTFSRRTISFSRIYSCTDAHPHQTVWNFPCLRIMTLRLSDVVTYILCPYAAPNYTQVYTIRVRVVFTKQFTLMCKNAFTDYKQTIGIL
jgi:hypothetical protein